MKTLGARSRNGFANCQARHDSCMVGVSGLLGDRIVQSETYRRARGVALAFTAPIDHGGSILVAVLGPVGPGTPRSPIRGAVTCSTLDGSGIDVGGNRVRHLGASSHRAELEFEGHAEGRPPIHSQRAVFAGKTSDLLRNTASGGRNGDGAGRVARHPGSLPGFFSALVQSAEGRGSHDA